MILPNILAALVIFVLFPLLVSIAWSLWSRSRERPKIRTLRLDAFGMAWLAGVVGVFALIFLNNGMTDPILDLYWTMVITRTALLSFAVPAIRWRLLYRRSKKP